MHMLNGGLLLSCRDKLEIIRHRNSLAYTKKKRISIIAHISSQRNKTSLAGIR